MEEGGGRAIKVTGLLINIIKRVLDVQYEVKGERNIPKGKHILFTPNHFTRFETFVVPYVLNKIPNLKYARSLAYKDLFLGKFGDYLKSLKVLSTGEKNKAEIITEDLISGAYNWIIYPEGQMMKSREIFTTPPFKLLPKKKLKISAHTGVATLAIKAEMAARKKGQIYICPVTISYLPLEVKDTMLSQLILRFMNRRHMPKRLKEEVMVEASLLSNSKITLQFHEPINVGEYLQKNSFIFKMPLMREARKTQMLIDYLRYPLTTRLMHAVYMGTHITFNHIFSFVMHEFAAVNGSEGGESVVSISAKHLKEVLFNICSLVVYLNDKTYYGKKYVLAEELEPWSLSVLLVHEQPCCFFEEALGYMVQKGFALKAESYIELYPANFLLKQPFHEVRLNNMMQVFYNEMRYFRELTKLAQKCFNKNFDAMYKENASLLHYLNCLDYKRDYNKFFEANVSKDREVGEPRFLFSAVNKRGIVLSHGFRAAPLEMLEMAEFLFKSGFNVYIPRLKGHGTTPEDLKNRTRDDWRLSFDLAAAILNRNSEKTFFCGFSMGGLLALEACCRLKNSGVATVSAALQIKDYKIHLAGVATAVTNLLDELTSLKAKNYIDSNPENPEINYNKTYFAPLSELEKLMKETRSVLHLVTQPATIISGVNDRIVAPTSAHEIYDGIGSEKKELIEFDFGTRHVIVRGKDAQKIFAKVAEFFSAQ